MAQKTNPTPPTPPVVEQTTTVSGYAISILAFIPVSKKDLARQVEIPTLLLAIQSGEKTIADLSGYLVGTDMKMNFINKRFPIDEARKMLEPKATVAHEPDHEADGVSGSGDDE